MNEKSMKNLYEILSKRGYSHKVTREVEKGTIKVLMNYIRWEK